MVDCICDIPANSSLGVLASNFQSLQGTKNVPHYRICLSPDSDASRYHTKVLYYCANLACRAAERPAVSNSDRGCYQQPPGCVQQTARRSDESLAEASGRKVRSSLRICAPDCWRGAAAVARLRDVYSCAHGCNITGLTSVTVPTRPKVCPPAQQMRGEQDAASCGILPERVLTEIR